MGKYQKKKKLFKPPSSDRQLLSLFQMPGIVLGREYDSEQDESLAFALKAHSPAGKGKNNFSSKW